MAEFNNDESRFQDILGGVSFDGEVQNQPNNFESQAQNQVFSFGEQVQENAGGEGVLPGIENNDSTVFKRVEANNLPVKPSVWSKVKNFLFKEIDLSAPVKIELTPYQQKVENEINDFLHQEVSFKGIFNIFKKQK